MRSTDWAKKISQPHLYVISERSLKEILDVLPVEKIYQMFKGVLDMSEDFLDARWSFRIYGNKQTEIPRISKATGLGNPQTDNAMLLLDSLAYMHICGNVIIALLQLNIHDRALITSGVNAEQYQLFFSDEHWTCWSQVKWRDGETIADTCIILYVDSSRSPFTFN